MTPPSLWISIPRRSRVAWWAASRSTEPRRASRSRRRRTRAPSPRISRDVGGVDGGGGSAGARRRRRFGGFRRAASPLPRARVSPRGGRGVVEERVEARVFRHRGSNSRSSRGFSRGDHSRRRSALGRTRSARGSPPRRRRARNTSLSIFQRRFPPLHRTIRRSIADPSRGTPRRTVLRTNSRAVARSRPGRALWRIRSPSVATRTAKPARKIARRRRRAPHRSSGRTASSRRSISYEKRRPRRYSASRRIDGARTVVDAGRRNKFASGGGAARGGDDGRRRRRARPRRRERRSRVAHPRGVARGGRGDATGRARVDVPSLEVTRAATLRVATSRPAIDPRGRQGDSREATGRRGRDAIRNRVEVHVAERGERNEGHERGSRDVRRGERGGRARAERAAADFGRASRFESRFEREGDAFGDDALRDVADFDPAGAYARMVAPRVPAAVDIRRGTNPRADEASRRTRDAAPRTVRPLKKNAAKKSASASAAWHALVDRSVDHALVDRSVDHETHAADARTSRAAAEARKSRALAKLDALAGGADALPDPRSDLATRRRAPGVDIASMTWRVSETAEGRVEMALLAAELGPGRYDPDDGVVAGRRARPPPISRRASAPRFPETKRRGAEGGGAEGGGAEGGVDGSSFDGSPSSFAFDRVRPRTTVGGAMDRATRPAGDFADASASGAETLYDVERGLAFLRKHTRAADFASGSGSNPRGMDSSAADSKSAAEDRDARRARCTRWTRRRERERDGRSGRVTILRRGFRARVAPRTHRREPEPTWRRRFRIRRRGRPLPPPRIRRRRGTLVGTFTRLIFRATSDARAGSNPRGARGGHHARRRLPPRASPRACISAFGRGIGRRSSRRASLAKSRRRRRFFRARHERRRSRRGGVPRRRRERRRARARSGKSRAPNVDIAASGSRPVQESPKSRHDGAREGDALVLDPGPNPSKDKRTPSVSMGRARARWDVPGKDAWDGDAGTSHLGDAWTLDIPTRSKSRGVERVTRFGRAVGRGEDPTRAWTEDAVVHARRSERTHAIGHGDAHASRANETRVLARGAGRFGGVGVGRAAEARAEARARAPTRARGDAAPRDARRTVVG